MRIQVSASIVLYNNRLDYLEKTIKCFLTTDLRVHLYLIDNSPTNLLKVFAEDSRITYIHTPENLGFGAGHNKAISQIQNKSQYHLILNPDIEFDNMVIPTLYDFMEEHIEVGNVIPKVYYQNGEIQPLCKLLPTPLTLFSRRFARYSKLTQKLNQNYELQNYNYNQVIDVPNLSGCFMFLRNRILQKTGGFDEKFFLYLEDVDLNRRIGELAKTVVYPYVSIQHHFRKGSYQDFALLKHHIRSAIYYFTKWGWFFDKKRKVINRKVLRKLQNPLHEM